mgnify:CR=1 FL=1
MSEIKLLFLIMFGIAGSLLIEYTKLKTKYNELELKKNIYKSNYINCLKVIGKLDPTAKETLDSVIRKELKEEEGNNDKTIQ